MNDEMLGAAARSVCEPDLARLCSYDGIDEYEFSEEFEAKMRGIFKYDRKINIRRRIKTALLIAAIFAAGFCIGMSNKMLWNYKTKEAEGGRMVTFNIGSVNDRKKRIDEIYTLGGIPEGYKRVIYDNTSYSSVQIWTEKPDGGKAVFFGQCVPAAYKDAFYPDETEISLEEENGIQYMFGESKSSGFNTLVWYQHGYVFYLSGEISKDEAFELCKTLKIEDTQ